MLSFDNTEIAFSGRTNQELRRAYWLYRLIGVNWLVRWAPSLLKVALTLRLPIVPRIRSTVFHHFCGGERIATCEPRTGTGITRRSFCSKLARRPPIPVDITLRR